MARLIVVTLALIMLNPALSYGAQKRAARKKHRRIGTGTIATSWTPAKDGLLYKYTRGLPHVDKVEVSEIRWTKDFQNQVLASATLGGEQAEGFMQIWRNLNDGTGMGCFSPAFNVKFYSGDKLLFGSTVCFHCHNLTLPNEGRGEIHAFDAGGESGQALLKAIQAALAKKRASRSFVE